MRRIGLLFLFGTLTLGACGGGEGSNSSAAKALTDSSYQGSREQAVINGSNGAAIALAAFDSNEQAVDGSSLSSGVSGDVNSSGGATPELYPGKRLAPTATVAPQITRTEQGCSGSLQTEIDLHSIGGDFSGQMLFDRFSEHCNEEIDGRVDFTGDFDPFSSEMFIDMLFNPLHYIKGSETVQLAGNMSMTLDLLDETFNGPVLLNLVVTEPDGKTYWLNNISMLLEEFSHSRTWQISGRFYEHEEGYVELLTLIPLVIDNASGLPTAGQFECQGANDSWARISFPGSLGAGSYQVEFSDGTPPVSGWL